MSEPKELIEMMFQLSSWLGQNNIDASNVKVYIEFPDESTRQRAEYTFKATAGFNLINQLTQPPSGNMLSGDYYTQEVVQIFGIKLEFGKPNYTKEVARAVKIVRTLAGQVPKL